MKFYLLEQDLRIADIAGVGSVPEYIEPLDWIQGKKLPPPRPDLRLMLMNTSGDFRGDIIGSLVTLFSDELKAVLMRLGVDNIDYFPVELEDPMTHEVEEGYWLVNILGLVACVDRAKSVMRACPSGGEELSGPFHVDEDRTFGLKLFRLAEDPTLIVINEDLKRSLDQEDLAGVRMRATFRFDGF
ncbi:imm11 family protein [Sorangium sp. So ce1024]|uniref:imm11 family protein n=1 Tax=Sorangium sp. So ce1024 TaxID=3133327 RepID=UPI003F025A11